MNLVNYIQKIKKINSNCPREWWGIPRIFLIIFFCLYVPLWIWTVVIAQPIVEQGYSKYLQLPVLASDSYEYQTLAQNILNQNAFVFERNHTLDPEFFRTPGYPLFLAVIEFIFTTPFAVTFIQICLVLCTAILIKKLADRLQEGSGTVAGSIYMLLPGVFFHSLILLSDTVFVFGLVYLVFLLLKEYHYKQIILAGIILGCLAYIRPIAQFLIPCVAAFVVVDLIACKEGKKAWVYGLTVLIIPIIMMLPWMYRNYIHSGVFSFSSVTSYNSLVYNIGGAWTQKIPVYKAVGLESFEAAYDLQNSKKINDFVHNELFSHFGKYIWYHFSATESFFFSTGANLWDVTIATYSKKLAFARYFINLEKLFNIIISVLFCLGAYKYRNNKLIIIGVLLVLYFWILTGPVAYARYRMPVDPFLLLGASLVLIKIKKLKFLKLNENSGNS